MARSRLQPTHKPGPGLPKGRTNNPTGAGPRRRTPGFIRTLRHSETSLDLLQLTYKNGNMPMAFRVEAARSAAPYEHKKMPIAIEGTDKPIPIVDAGKLAAMSTAELEDITKALAVLAGVEREEE